LCTFKFQRGSERKDWLGPWLPKGIYWVQNSQIIKNYKCFIHYGKTYLGIYIFAGSSSHFSRFYLEEKRTSKIYTDYCKNPLENFLQFRKYKLYAKQSHMNSLGGCMPLFFKFIFLFIHILYSLGITFVQFLLLSLRPSSEISSSLWLRTKGPPRVAELESVEPGVTNQQPGALTTELRRTQNQPCKRFFL
jgi:hypothetical protein